MKNTPLILFISMVLLGKNIFCPGFSTCVRADESHPGLGIEAMYSDAVLAYNKKQTDEALKFLNEILKEQPNHVEALELRALALKEKGDKVQALDSYQRLATLKPEKERGPYLFASAVILQEMKKPLEAKADFEQALRLGFNTGACHLFLGIIAFNAGDMRESGTQFDELKSEGSSEMKVISNYYLGLIDFKNGDGPSGTAHIAGAKSLAERVPDSQIARDILSGANKILEPFNKSAWFGNVSVMAGYDSNVAQVPGGSNAQSTGSGASTGKAMLAGGVGGMTPPLSTIQVIPSYRFNGNLNSNGAPNSESFEFFTNTASLYLNYRPLEETSGGLKLEGNFIFQNQPVDPANATGAYQFQKYALSSEMGPFVKFQLNPRLKLEFELYVRPSTYYITPGFGGMDSIARVTLRNDGKNPFLNIGISLSYEDYVADDDNLKFLSPDLGISDMIHLGSADTLTVSLDYTYFGYNVANPVRFDNQLLFHATETHALAAKGWAVVGDATYTNNSSNQSDTFSYDRFTLMGGVSKTF